MRSVHDAVRRLPPAIAAASIRDLPGTPRGVRRDPAPPRGRGGRAQAASVRPSRPARIFEPVADPRTGRAWRGPRAIDSPPATTLLLSTGESLEVAGTPDEVGRL